MNFVNIAKHRLYLTQMEFHFQNSTTSEDKALASQQLFQILKTFEDSYFNELHTYEPLDFHDEYDKMTDEGDSADEEQNIDECEESQYLDIQNNFTLEEMEDIVEWVDQHPNYIMASIKNRTLSFTGERITEVVVKRKNNLTHSYTVQPITSADSQLLGKFFLILQEKENDFGTRIQRDLIVPPNVGVRASKSRKSSDEKHRTFLNEVLRPLVDSPLLIFPQRSTGHIQLQDLSLFRSWRFIHEKLNVTYISTEQK
ncbi:unnamed protein product [Rotaria magnacalcarata]|uniref:Uncharacterized protein n=1 Tax=Rotaria magnacalcarata TaxID=392030 RepID=A0A8S2Q8W1_9BILA|nr:unnamed protein product [Rotaria magnacalcarata]